MKVVNGLLLVVFTMVACSVESPDIADKTSTGPDFTAKTEQAINDQLGAITQTFQAFDSLLSVVNSGMSRREVTESDRELVSPLFASNLQAADGELNFVDEKGEEFEYEVNSDASLRLASDEAKVRFFLNGHVKDVEGVGKMSG